MIELKQGYRELAEIGPELQTHPNTPGRPPPGWQQRRRCALLAVADLVSAAWPWSTARQPIGAFTRRNFVSSTPTCGVLIEEGGNPFGAFTWLTYPVARKRYPWWCCRLVSTAAATSR